MDTLDQAPVQTFPIAPRAVRYIKFGINNAWFPSARDNNRIEFGHSDVSHELASRLDRAGIAQVYLNLGREQGKASDYAREVLDFYGQGEDTLWITFAEGCLWWGFARPEVIMIGETPSNGERCRLLVAPWSNCDAYGRRLTIVSLSTRLTKVASYRQTICRVEAAEYLVRRINGVDDPAVAKAKQLRCELLDTTRSLIGGLHWRDFEVLCDLILTRSGWQRIGELGGVQKDTDLVMEQLATGERAFVQIKSASDQSVLTDYVDRFEADPAFARMFFICHSPRSNLTASASKPIHVWAGEVIAEQAITAGLLDWLIEKAG